MTRKSTLESVADQLLVTWRFGGSGSEKLRFKDIVQIARKSGLAQHNEQVSRMLEELRRKGFVRVHRQTGNSRKLYFVNPNSEVELREWAMFEEMSKSIDDLKQKVHQSLPNERKWLIAAIFFSIGHASVTSLYKIAQVRENRKPLADAVLSNYISKWKELIESSLEIDTRETREAFTLFERAFIPLRDPTKLPSFYELE